MSELSSSRQIEAGVLTTLAFWKFEYRFFESNVIHDVFRGIFGQGDQGPKYKICQEAYEKEITQQFLKDAQCGIKCLDNKNG